MPESSRRKKEKRNRHGPGNSKHIDAPDSEGSRSTGLRGIKPRTWKKIRRWLIYAASAIAAAAVIGGIVASSFAGTGGGGPSDDESIADPNIGQKIALLNRTHIPEGDPYNNYNSIPPTSGAHWGTGWARCGIYDNEEEVPDPRIVHNLEHGQVVINHNLTEEVEIDRLKDVARSLSKRRSWMIMRPYARLSEGEVALTAWGWLDRFEGVEEERIRGFYNAHVNKAPESIPCLQGG